MPINNLNNSHLTEAQITQINDSLTDLEAALAMLTVTLTAEERQTYGSVNEQNKLLVNKVRDFHRDTPSLAVPEVDWVEFEKDYNSRLLMESILNRLGALQERVKNTKILHDYDNYQTALEDYAYTSYRAGSSTPGYETKRTELKQFFARSGKSAVGGTTEPNP